MQTWSTIGIDEATKAIDGAIAEADRENVKVSIAIVDRAGDPIMIARMDGASGATVRFALEKAKSTISTGLDTFVLQESLKDQPELSTIGLMLVQGGLPVLYKDEFVGAIGVSGAQANQDGAIASAALTQLRLQ